MADATHTTTLELEERVRRLTEENERLRSRVAAEEPVVAGRTGEPVGAGAAADDVIAAPADDGVITAADADQIVAAGTRDQLAALAANPGWSAGRGNCSGSPRDR